MRAMLTTLAVCDTSVFVVTIMISALIVFLTVLPLVHIQHLIQCRCILPPKDNGTEISTFFNI